MNYNSKLLRIINILSLNSSKQILYLESIGIYNDNIDELALEFFDEKINSNYKILFSNRPIIKELIEKIDYIFLENEKKEKFWTLEALKKDSNWEVIRDISRSILNNI